MARKSIETRDPLAEEKSVAQMASESLDIEEKAKQKKKRIRRSKITIILDRIKKMYEGRVKADVYADEFAKIEASLTAMENAKTKKKKISEADVLSLFTVEQLQEMIAKKQAN